MEVVTGSRSTWSDGRRGARGYVVELLEFKTAASRRDPKHAWLHQYLLECQRHRHHPPQSRPPAYSLTKNRWRLAVCGCFSSGILTAPRFEFVFIPQRRTNLRPDVGVPELTRPRARLLAEVYPGRDLPATATKDAHHHDCGCGSVRARDNAWSATASAGAWARRRQPGKAERVASPWAGARSACSC